MMHAIWAQPIKDLIAAAKCHDKAAGDSEIRQELADLINTGGVHDYLAEQLRAVLRSPYAFNKRWQPKSVVLVESDSVRLAIHSMDAMSRFSEIADSEVWIGLIRPNDNPENKVAFREYLSCAGETPASNTASIMSGHVIWLSNGDVYKIQPGNALYCLAESPVAVLALHRNSVESGRRVRNSDGAIFEANRASVKDDALCAGLEVLAEFADIDAFDIFRHLETHSNEKIKQAAQRGLRALGLPLTIGELLE